MSIGQRLLGMFQTQPDQFQTLLGQYYDPRTARQQWLGGTLQGLGAGLASGEPGAWAQGAIAGGGRGVEDYRKRALLGYQVQQQADNQAYDRSRDAKADERWQTQFDYNVGQDQKRLALEQQRLAQSQSSDPHYGLNPIWARGADGSWQLFQPDQKGGAPLQVQFPEGVSPQPQVSFQDLGTGIQAVTNRGAIPVGEPMPKDLAGAESQKEQGAASGKAIAAAPADIQAADNALTILEQIKNSPNLEQGTGFSSLGNVIPGTAGFDFQNIVDQATSGAFLSAIQQMRGMGSLSNAEGQTATAAVTRMNTATSKEAFLAALSDYEAIIMQGKARATARLSGGQASDPISKGNRLKFNPATGELE